MKEDIQLASKAAGGDLEALAVLIDHHRTALFRIAYRELGRYDDAQDAVAETIVRACRYVHRLKSAAQFGAWIRTMARNEARRIRKQNQVSQERDAEYQAQVVMAQTQPDSLRDTVRHALSQLPTELAQVMVMFYLNGASVREIAEVVGRPEGTVKWMLSRSRAKLATLLKKDFTMTLSIQKTYRAVLIAPDLPTTEQQAIADAVKRGGWDEVQTISDPAQVFVFNGSVPTFLNGQMLVILDERIGSTSAFELMPLLVAARKEHGDFALGLLLREGRTEDAKNVAVWSAYVSGVDFLLTHPLLMDEVTGLTAQMRKQLVSKAV